MKVKRLVANFATPEPARAAVFYKDILGLDLLMDHGWIQTYGSQAGMTVQLSFASEGGSGTPVPDLSIEVDDVNEAFERMKAAGFAIEYGPADEPWGVRRFYVRDPFGKLVNILAHA
ncbi:MULTISPECIES: VOC family protein [unclassified Variovorax]|jgi:lactoylglutathione lyase|uniref:VOC family protein n=1 Tax=unclassified Variovorax TaxID=663243 RepID=UPI000F7D89F2|nr:MULTISPECIES: VOC family protein [unclassified Variovorax]RSZ30677.1 glyoxalase [Variovorax sp. 553]RSZ31214.1 glyoxalase [Variovorax sp. 679]